MNRKPRVLVAEDNLVNQRVAARMLEKLGCSVDLTSDGRAAVEASRSIHYDAIFLDCHMPVLDGIRAAEKIRALDCPSSEAPIIAVTAEVYEETRALCMAAGMDDFLAKPLRLIDLRAALERWLPEAVASAAGAGD